MPRSISVPIKIVQGAEWGELSSHGPSLSHQICGEIIHKGSDVSFQGGHRVRSYTFKKNVHWRIPGGVELDISAAEPAEPPKRRQQGKRRHDNRL
jgi:hypothetical protein